MLDEFCTVLAFLVCLLACLRARCIVCAMLVPQIGLSNPLSGAGPSTYVVCQHLGTFGIATLQANAAMRVKASVGRASVEQSTKYMQSFPTNSPSTLFILPMATTKRSTDTSAVMLHVVVLSGNSGRCVFVCVLGFDLCVFFISLRYIHN